MGRGKEVGKAQQISEQQIQLSREQMQQQNDLMKQELGKRNQLLDPLYQSLLPYIQQRMEGGMTPETQAALRSQAIESVPGRFDSAQSELVKAMGRRGMFGGAQPTSAMAAPYFSDLARAKEQTRAGMLRDIILQNEEAKTQGAGMGLNLGGVVTGSYNPSPFISGAGNALGQAGEATGVRAGLIKPGFWDYAAPVLGAAAGAAGSYFTGGYARPKTGGAG